MFKPVKKTFRSLRVNKDKVAQWLVTIPPGRFVTTRGGVVIVNNGDDFADLVVYTSREQQKQFEQTGRRFPEGISLNYKNSNKFNDSGENPESPLVDGLDDYPEIPSEEIVAAMEEDRDPVPSKQGFIERFFGKDRVV